MKYLAPFLCTALFKMGNDSGGPGGRIKDKEALQQPCNPESAGVMSRKDKDWLLKSYLGAVALADRH